MKKAAALLFMTVFLLAAALPVSAASKVYANADVNLRKGPGLEYKIYTSVAEGTVLKYIKTKKDDRGVKWYKVSYKKKKLWVSSRFATKMPQPVTPSKNRVETTGNVYLRKGPGTKYKKVAVVMKGSSLKYLGQTKNDSRGVPWYKVSFYGKKVWVSSRYAVRKNTEHSRKVVTTEAMNLRKGPSIDYKAYTSVPKGTVMKYLGKSITDERGIAWYKVSYKGKALWVSSKYSYIRN